MAAQCCICHEAADHLQLVVYNKERGQHVGYLVLDDTVVFDRDKIAKFLYFCETQGLHAKNNDILDLCEDCLLKARIGMN